MPAVDDTRNRVGDGCRRRLSPTRDPIAGRDDLPVGIDVMLRHGKDGSEMSENAAMSRRKIVRAAAGAMTLAASGLYLPAEMEEAEAREGALDGALGGRRRQHQRGRPRRHDPGDRKRKRKQDNEPAPPGKGVLKNIQVRVMNLSANPFSFLLINDVVRIPATIRARQWLAETDLQDDQGWIWMETCACQVTGVPLGLAIFLNNPTFGGVWYRVWADMGLMPDRLTNDSATWPLTEPTTIAERQEVVIPSPRPWEGVWDLRLRRFDDSDTFKRFELEFRGIRPAAH
jgi:hypothetical protein